ncbi:hypothetical protein FALBO_5924 [Fusarium albosuccineum]|uniref:Uncharacterized protein n=1 Tax=Fusarium albosuccineum TaxID=1237068 RepID=A0A8H4LF51_9HYPO|nr:hypothetical protein FALBO_5924 [Fusarium albosuccineum]
MVMLQFVLLALSASATLGLEQRSLKCANPKVKAFASSARKVASKEVDGFCSSYLHYKTRTTTVTSSTTTWSYQLLTISGGTDTEVSTISASATGTETVTQTIGVFPDLRKREAAYGPPPPAPTRHITADSHGNALGFSSGVVRDACSCLVTSPPPVTKTRTKVATSTFVFMDREYATTTTTTTTSTHTDFSTGTQFSTVTYANPTNCGTPAQPTFFIQLRDVNALMDGWRQAGLIEDAITLSKDKKRATLLTLEPKTGYLRAVHGGRYLNNDYFSYLTIPSFMSKKDIDVDGFQYNACKIVQSGKVRELVCHAEGSAWDMRFYQTCQIYEDWYSRPFAIGNAWFPDIPCSLKRLIIVDACA